MYDDRLAALEDLLLRVLPAAEAVSRLSQFGWDSERPLRELRPHLVSALQDAAAGRLSLDELAAWAEAVEGREDLAYEEPVNSVLFELASPDINGLPTHQRLADLARSLGA